LTVPTAAVIDSGTRQIVLVQLKEGRFEPRDVKVGARSDDRIEVTEGVREGEQVVIAANFLIDAEANLKAAVGGFGHSSHGAKSEAQGTPDASKPAASVGHQGEGRVEESDAKAGTVTIAHGPIPSLKWPAMSMEFKVSNNGLMAGLQPGAAVVFEFVERGQGEWVVTAVKPMGKAAATPHAGHN
jgi:Cu(I)/Ag(I) efflux system membrane fusion protein/cobalt-zinc-cadmium efflux system membrane fusion protein